MALPLGTRLGAYEIREQIGSGGMGEVYRATDTNLARPVAIKMLPDSMSADADRLMRLELEAQMLAAVNHPNIAAVYGLERSDGRTALVMELVDGPTLADRIADGPIPVDEAVAIARQIADALEAAHERGIIHRDLKPGNVKLRPDGTVKVLDFGLAKPLDRPSAAASDVNETPTITSPALMTSAGVILGTAAYMSPEQARGKKTDQRTDIWAFGVVLYEMVTGQRLFDGDDVTETIANVVKQQPDLGRLPRTLRKVVDACLKKDPRDRLQAIGDWKLLVGETDSDSPIQTQSHRAQVATLAIGFVLVTVALVALAFRHYRETAPEQRIMQLSVPLPSDTEAAFLELSPDGRRLLLVLAGQGPIQLYVRSLDSPELIRLPGTNGARNPFWSPDSRSIAFFADGSLKVMSAAGGPAQLLCTETGLGRGGTWSRDEGILFATEDGVLKRVSPEGGECGRVAKETPNYRARFPVFLPDGRQFLYVHQSDGEAASVDVYVAALDELPGRKLLAGTSSVIYAPALPGRSSHVLFLRERTLMAQRFDAASLLVQGDPFVVAEQALITFSRQVAATAAADGTLVYLAGRSNEAQLTWLDRTGKELEKVGPRATQSGVTLLPDGNAATVFRSDPN